ncbi:hypothetical protein DFH06DRAFT_1475010 [Mycena polygramma]|nr:hypothetical protein DFH06DRAFT_1475010 [Mycena polygramma]
MYPFVRGVLAGALANLPVLKPVLPFFKTPNEVLPAFSTNTVQNVLAAPLHLALPQVASYAPETATSYSTSDAFNLAILLALFAICLRHTTLSSHIVKYFVGGTTLLLSPSWVPPSFKLLLSLLKTVSEAVPAIYTESLVFWTSLFKRACQGLAASATEASCSDSPPLPMTVQLVWALILPTLGCFALQASIPYVLRLRSSSLCALYVSLTFRASNCLAIAEGTLYRLSSSIPRLFSQAIKLLCMHTCVFVSSLGTQSRRIIENSLLATFRHVNEFQSHLSQALLSRVAATTTGLSCRLQRLPSQEKRLVYTVLLLFFFAASAFVHVACLGYPLPLAILLAVGWTFALVFACYVNSQPHVDYDPDQPAPNVLLHPTARPAPSEVVPIPALALAPSSPEDLPQSAPHSPIPSRHSSPAQSSSASYSSSSDEESESELDDWSNFVPHRPRSRRSFVFTVRAPPLSPIAEVSSVASTASVSSLCSSPSSSPRLRSRSFSSGSGSGSATPSPPASPVTTMMREVKVEAAGKGTGTRDVRQVARARARSDMAEFRSFSLALERRTGELRAGSDGGGSELQSNGVVFDDLGVVRLGEVEGAVARSKAEEARVCRYEYDSVYCTGECWERNKMVGSKVGSL